MTSNYAQKLEQRTSVGRQLRHISNLPFLNMRQKIAFSSDLTESICIIRCALGKNDFNSPRRLTMEIV